MKIVMLVLNNFTHDTRVHKEAKTLASAGHNVMVYALWEAGLPYQETRAGYQICRISLHSRRWRGGSIAPLIKYMEFVVRVLQKISQQPTDVIHAHDAKPLPIAWLSARRTGAHLIYDAHELETGRNFGGTRLAGIYQLIWAWPERAFIHRADVVITVCEGIADELMRLYGILRPTVVKNCPEKQSPRSTNLLREKLSISNQSKIVLYQGAVIAGRGLETMASAVQQLPNVVGVILGNGSLLEYYRAQVAKGNWVRMYLPGRVPLSQLPSYTASADIGVSLIQNTCRSYYYALPNKLFEYIQAGIPVVGSNLPEIAKVITTYRIGEVVDPDDPAAVAAAIQKLLDDPHYYARIRANTAHAARVFNWERESEKLLALYDALEG